MTLTNVVKSSGLAAVFLLLPASGFGAPHSCQPPQPQMSSATCPCAGTSQSSATWNFQKEGSLLLSDINRDARVVRTEASTAESEYPYQLTGKEMQSYELSVIREKVNDMGQRLCRLETIHGQLTPSQQKAVDSTAPLIKELAIFTTDAIQFVNDHPANLWNPTYHTYIRDIHSEAVHVPMAVRNEG